MYPEIQKWWYIGTASAYITPDLTTPSTHTSQPEQKEKATPCPTT
jgi:hypothetical protein